MSRASATTIEVRPARPAREQKQFLDLPYRLHRHQEHWIAPLRMSQKDILDTARHPFYKTAEVEKFLAYRDGRVVGRIMAIDNRAYNEFHNERAGSFGFFEVEEDYEAAAALLDAAKGWLASRGAVVMQGPFNPSTNYELGILVEGFDLDPTIMMVWNPPYYGEFLERYGLRKAADLFAYDIAEKFFIVSDKLKRVAERLQAKDRIRVRPVNLKDFKREVEIVRRVYNDAWSRNWGFVPVTDEEFEHIGKDMKQIVDPRIVLIAEQEIDGQEPRPIGFMLAVPDLNRALKKLNGRLFPFGLIKLLWHSRKIDSVRIITMGIIREFQSRGAGAILLSEIYDRAPAAGFPSGEMGWVLDSNVMMNRAAELIGARRTKTYRIYEMPLTAATR